MEAQNLEKLKIVILFTLNNNSNLDLAGYLLDDDNDPKSGLITHPNPC